MELHKIDKTLAPNTFARLANISAGREGIIYLVTLGLETSPPWGRLATNGTLINMNNYVEGCFHLLRNSAEEWPGMVLGTGLEDFFDSAFGFSIVAPGIPGAPPLIRSCEAAETDGEQRPKVCLNEGVLWQGPTSGLLHFSADYSDPDPTKAVERISAYRFLDDELVGVDDGGAFGWENGCAKDARKGTNKCGESSLTPAGSSGGMLPHSPIGTGYCLAHPTRVRAYVWVYTWPKAAPTSAPRRGS